MNEKNIVNNKTVLAIPVRQFMSFTPKELMNGLKTNLYVLFEDNVVVKMTHREIILTRYILRILEVYPNIPIVSKYAISNYYTNNIFTAKSINSCFEVIYADIVNMIFKPMGSRKYMSRTFKAMYDIVSDIYDELVYSNLDYVTSIDIEDFISIQFDPELIAAIKEANANKNTTTINKTYEVLDRIIKTKPEYKDNPLALGYISGTVNPNQVKQMLASRGYVTELNSAIFKYPIVASFTLGNHDIYSLATESRTGAKALFLSTVAIKESEYLARELQLVTMNVEKLVDGDCGSKEYMSFYVRPASDNNGKSDIKNILGLRYLNDKGEEEPITMNHTFLEGKTIQLRVPANCKLSNLRHICTACFGELSYNIPITANIGHLASTSISERITQMILSTKHHASSSSGSNLILDDISSKFFIIKNNAYYFKPGLISKSNKIKYKIIVNPSEGFGIKDINKSVDIHKLNPNRVSRLASILLVVTVNDKEDINYINIKTNNSYGSFSIEFLKYIQEYGYYLNDIDQYVIELDNWVTTAPFIVMPEVEYNFLHLTKAFRKMYKSTSKTIETKESLTQATFDIINTKLDAQLAMISTMVYAFTAADVKNRDYRLGRFVDTPDIIKIPARMLNGSLGGGFAWQSVIKNITSGSSYNGKNAINHPLDVMIDAQSTLLDRYGKVPTKKEIILPWSYI